MSYLKRYNIYTGQHLSGDYATLLLHTDESASGKWVKWDDCVKLQAENERLRYAGDRMHSKMYSLSFGWKTDEQDAWEATKEGSDAK